MFPLLTFGIDEVEEGFRLILGVRIFGLTDLDLLGGLYWAGLSTWVA
jgi:hypothetical protein